MSSPSKKPNPLTRGKKSEADEAAREGRLLDAQQLFQAVCKTDGMDVEAWVKLALIEKRLGRLTEAERCARRGLALAPQLGFAHHALAVVRHNQGHVEEAWAGYRRATTLQPDFPDAHYLLGLACHELGQLEQAAASYQRALRLQPGLIDAQVHLGLLLIGQNQLQAGEQLLQRALLQQPDHVLALSNLGQVQRLQNRYDEAEQTFRRALRLQPEATDLLAGLADHLEKTGQLAEARQLAEQGLALDPQHPQLNMTMALLERHDKQIDAAVARLDALLTIPMSVNLLGDVELALGALYDQQNRSEQAFAMFTAGKQHKARLALPGGVYDGAYLRQVQALQALASAELGAAIGAARQREPLGSAGPIFMIGFPRSGTTLLEQVLESHPQIQALEEKPAVQAVYEALRAAGEDSPIALAALSDERMAALREVYFAEVARHLSLPVGSVLLDKLPLNAIYLPLIQRLFPTAPIILALRHPADVCLSCLMQNFAANAAMSAFHRLDTTVELYEAVMQSVQRAREQLPLRLIEQRYEDLIADVEGQARRLIDFLGLPWDDAVLEHTEHARQRATINSPSYHQVVQPIYQTAKYRWQRYEAQLADQLPRLQPFVDHYGYGSP
ncbi:sulfotransferase [Paucibacter sp. APW11]|uniref:Sulfotransferase n=1 Tax=Roseateles aquae TaxID=3077235 RepID=A0ABU3PBS3_9BURK|nr:sulfotransferase [Paucibacter sp. APW11]MDT9000006.1 sulfotransferase [Paucibacter sp. APW11]